jgi:hypothetical protein
LNTVFAPRWGEAIHESKCAHMRCWERTAMVGEIFPAHVRITHEKNDGTCAMPRVHHELWQSPDSPARARMRCQSGRKLVAPGICRASRLTFLQL